MRKTFPRSKKNFSYHFAVTYLRQYLLGQKIVLNTDHNPLKLLMNHSDVASKLIRWVMCLQQFDIEIRYRTGKSNANADTLSRIKSEETNKILHNFFATVKNTSNMAEFQRDQEPDEDIK